MLEPLAPYLLPHDVRGQLLEIAADADLLILGEIHGVAEVPRIVLGLLDDLEAIGYAGLGLEIPRHHRDQLLRWIRGEVPETPAFFAPAPVRDGRGNAEMASLMREVVVERAAWSVLCFDASGPFEKWSDRDRAMAVNLLEQWEAECSDRKVIAVCGNVHSRLSCSDHAVLAGLWPSFARCMQDSRPDLIVKSIDVVFHSGTFFNMELREFGGVQPPLETEGEFRSSGSHSIALHLPRGTAATFLPE